MFIEGVAPPMSFKSVGGPSFPTLVHGSQSGFESRPQNYTFTRGEWTVNYDTPSDASSGLSPWEFLEALQGLFLVAGVCFCVLGV
jgi:hypothetical protein